jgi:hypothetical protein
MAVFTTLTKNRLSWPSREVVVTAEVVDFVFSDASDFLFSDGTDYVFSEGTSERTPTPWTSTIKSSHA